jgi:hypothetical protein
MVNGIKPPPLPECAKTVPGGEIDALDPGGFGALTITKAITIRRAVSVTRADQLGYL